MSRLLSLLFLLTCFGMQLQAQTQSISYEMKVTRIFSNYPVNQDQGNTGPDIVLQLRTRLVGMGADIAQSTDLYFPDLAQTGWIDIPDKTIAAGVYSSTDNPLSLCGTGIGVVFDNIRFWEHDIGPVQEFDNDFFGSDDDPLSVSSPVPRGAPELVETSGETRIFQEVFTNLANGYYGLEFSVTYAIENGIREVIYTGDTDGGPVAGACGGGQVYLHPRTGPLFTGGRFQYDESLDNGVNWSPLGGPTYNDYKSVIVTDDPDQKFRVRLVGGGSFIGPPPPNIEVCLGNSIDQAKEPINIAALRRFPSIDPQDILVNFTESCPNEDSGTVTVESIGTIPADTDIRLQLERLSGNGVQVLRSSTLLASTFPFEFTDVPAGDYQINATVITGANVNQVLSNCTSRSQPFVVDTRNPEPLLGVQATAIGCGESTGAVEVFSSAVTQVYEILDVSGGIIQASPSTSAAAFTFNNLAPGNYRARSRQSACTTEEIPFIIAVAPGAASGTVEIIEQAPPFDVACRYARTSVNFRGAVGTGTYQVVVYTADENFEDAFPIYEGTVSEGGVFTAPLFAFNYIAEFTRLDNGCSSQINFTVDEDPNQLVLPNCEFGDCPTQSPTSCDPNSGQVTFSITNGVPPYSLTFNGATITPASTTPVTNGTEYFYNTLSSGNYLVNVTDSRGCLSQFDFNIFSAPDFSIRLNSSSNRVLDCNGDTDGSANIIVNNFASGTPPYEYKVPEINDVFGPSSQFSNIPPGVYTAVARDGAGCEAEVGFEIVEPEPILINDVYVDPPVCSGGVYTVYIAASGPVLFDNSSTDEISFGTFPPLWQYYEYSTDGGSSWNNIPRTTAASLSPDNISADQRIFLPLIPGDYSIILRRNDVDNCRSNTVNITAADFNVVPPLSLSLETAQDPSCAGGSDGLITINYSGGSSGYELELVTLTNTNPPTGATALETIDFLSAAGSYTFDGLPGGNVGYAFRLRTKNADGTLPNPECVTYFPGNYAAGESFTPIFLTPPTDLEGVTLVTSQPLDCTGTGAAITISGVNGGTPPYEYSNNGQPFTTATTLDAVEENTITIRDAAGCTTMFQYTVTQRSESPAQLGFAQLPPQGCNPSYRVELSVILGDGPFSYAYSQTDNGNSEPLDPIINNTEQTSLEIDNLQPGPLYVRLTTIDGCDKYFIFDLIDTQIAPLGSMVMVTPETCANDGNGSITLVAQGGVPPVQVVFAGVVTTGDTRIVTDLSSGTHVFGIRDAAGCSIIQQVELSPSSEGFPITIGGDPATPCGTDENGSIELTPTGGVPPFTLVWSDGAPGATIAAIGESAIRTGLSRAEYPLTITDGNGCVVVRSPLPGGRAPLIAELIDVVQPECGVQTTGSFTVNIVENSFPASSTFMVSINGAPPVDQLVFTDLTEGDYTIDVIDDGGCGLLDPLMITIAANGAFSVSSSVVDVSCGGTETGSVTITATGNNGPFEYALAGVGFQSGPSFFDLGPGTYDFLVRASDGCVVPINGVVVNDGPYVDGQLMLNDPACNGEATGSIEVMPSGGTAPYTYSLNGAPAQNDPIFTNLAGGVEYQVLITDANGCEFQSLPETLPQPDPVTAAPTPTVLDCFGDADASIAVLASGGDGTYQYRIGGGAYAGAMNFTGLAAGDYQIQARDGNGCESEVIDVNIPAPDEIAITLSGTTPENCGLSDGTASATAAGGTGNLSLSWPGNQSGATATGLSAGTYQLTVTDASNCTQTQEFTIGTSGGPSLSLQNVAPSRCDANTGVVEVSPTGGQAPFTYTWSHDANLNSPLAQNLAADDYTVTITDANDCTFELTETVAPSPEPTLAIGTVNDSRCTDDNGEATVIPDAGTAPYTYEWSHAAGLNTPTLSDLPAGNYTVTLTDANGCTAEQSFTLSFLAGPSGITATENIPTTCGLNNGRLSLGGQGGAGPYTFTWADFPAETGGARDDLPSGDYAVTISDANNCTVSSIFTVAGSLTPTVSVAGQTDATCGVNNGTASLATTNFNGQLTYTWSHDGTINGPLADNLAAGAYSVTVTDINMCTAEVQLSIGSAGGPSLTLQNVAASRCDANTGVVEVSPSGGQAPFTYTWSHDTNLNSPLAQNLTADDYTVTITDANDCSFELTETVASSPEPTLALGQVNDSRCTDDNGEATVIPDAGTAPYNYAWSHAAGLNTPTLSDLAAGNYTVTVTDANGCTAEQNLTVNFVSGPSGVTATENIPTTCGLDNGRLSLDGQGGTGPYTFTWADFPGETTGVRNDLPDGDYAVTITDANNCTVNTTFTVDGSLMPTVSVAGQTETTCGAANGTASLATANFNGQLTYAWSHDANLNAPLAENLAAGAYSVTITDINLCSAEVQLNIGSADGPGLILQNAVASRCDANTGSLEVTPENGQAPFNYTWSHDANLNSSLAENLAAGNYTVTITDANDCTFELTETVAPSPEPTLAIGAVNDSRCTDDNGEATVIPGAGTTPYTYAWSHAAGLNTPTLDDLTAGDYTVTVTDANGCTAEQNLTVNFIPGPNGITATENIPTTCGLDNGRLSLDGQGGAGPYTFTWADFPGETGGVLDQLPSGDYAVTITDANNCTVTASFNVAASPTPSVSINQQTEATCGVANAMVSLSTQNFNGLLTYDWSHDATINGPEANNLPEGTGSVLVTDENNCQATVAFTIISAEGPLLVLSQLEADACDTGSGVMEVTPTGGQTPFTYTWSHNPNLNAPLAIGLSGGDYSVTITDANNCFFELMETVPISLPPSLGVEQVVTSICGDGNGSAVVAATGGTPPYTYDWSHAAGQNSPQLDNLLAGDYTVTVTDVNGCTDEVELTVGLIPEVTGITVLNQVNTTCGLDNGLLSLTGQGGTPPYRFNWPDFPDNETGLVEGVAAGTYPVTVIDVNDCTFTAAFTVVGSASPSVVLISQTDASCGLPLGRIEVEARDFTGLLVYEWSHDANLNEPIAEGLTGGEYTVLVRDALDCQASLTITVGDESGPALALAATNNSLCEDGNGSVEVNYTGGGQEPFTYAWSHDLNLNAPLAEDLTAGDYSVTITDANGCTASVRTTVGLEASPAINDLSIAPAICAQNNGQANIIISGGTPPLLYTWSHNPNLNEPMASDLPPGEITFTVTDANGCFDSRRFTIEDQVGPTAINTVELVATTCALDNGRISVATEGGLEPLDYTWSHDENLNAPLAENLAPGNYELTVTDVNGCTLEAAYEILPSTTPSIIVDSLRQTNCGENTGYIAVSVENANGNLIYQWSHDQDLNGPVASDLPAAAYTLIVIDEAGCFDERLFVINNQNNPAEVSASATASVCTDDNGSVTVSIDNGQPPFVYDWRHDPQLEGPLAENLAMGEYVISVSDAGGCTAVVSATVAFESAPVASLDITPLDCDGSGLGSLAVNLNGGTMPFRYRWNTGDATEVINDLIAGDYQVTVTDANGCTSEAAATIETLNLPTLELVATTAGDCLPNGGSATLTTNLAADGFTINWPGPDSAISLTNLAGGGTEITFSPLAAGSYPITIQQGSSCTAMLEVTVAAAIEWSTEIGTVTPPNCFDTADGAASVNVTGPGVFTFRWDAAAGAQGTPTASNLGPGNYQVSVTDADGCLRELSTEITAPDTLELVLTSQSDPLCAGDSTGTLTVMGSGGTGDLSYAWNVVGLPPTPEQTALPTGDYTVTLSDANGCTEALSVSLTAPTAGVLDIPTDTTICQDDLFVLDLSAYTAPGVTGPDNFSSTDAVSLLETEGTYQVTASDDIGCILEAELELEVTDAAFLAGMILPSDVVLGDSVAVLETSWPAPQTVSWVIDRPGGRQVRQVGNQYWFLFDEVGEYQLSLIAGFGGCEDVTTKRITVHADSTTIPNAILGRPQIQEVVISPNPNDGQFGVAITLSEAADVFLNLYDNNGARIERRQAEGQATYDFVYSLNNPRSGAYYLVIQTAFGRRSVVILVE